MGLWGYIFIPVYSLTAWTGINKSLLFSCKADKAWPQRAVFLPLHDYFTVIHSAEFKGLG